MSADVGVCGEYMLVRVARGDDVGLIIWECGGVDRELEELVGGSTMIFGGMTADVVFVDCVSCCECDGRDVPEEASTAPFCCAGDMRDSSGVGDRGECGRAGDVDRCPALRASDRASSDCLGGGFGDG